MELNASQTVGKIATSLPGAAALFRRHGISFCCGGSDSIGAAAEAAGLSPETLVDELQGLVDAASTEAPDGTVDLINHLRTRYHDTHRADLISLIPLAAKVERVHRDHPDAPIGLANLLERIQSDLHSHMHREELMLFPLMERGDHHILTRPIEQMRHEHEVEVDHLAELEHVTGGFHLPDGACTSWRALYAGAKKFADDLIQHMHLENEVLFPRFTGGTV
ncbi:iron-sulfur cluster repair di-iron protein [Mycoplana rhizolycopersici]|uniref:Iron-sulfur cluster repair di-iron protein n=1 Tax=Mycoplana rhizolycopersici TaxID=2746702 RepID=A0ABX2QL66_9HYPH|nr:iron-sulfur cluster repair di-iron protein [Rhizobium rhizolycopersici]NVP58539.1 iron-sulfur cluster repair di-iron protein [Rhizobium rhizolycopersici]